MRHRTEAIAWRWQIWALIMLGAVVIVLGLYWDTAVSIVTAWYRSATFTHGFLVLPLSLYLIWIRRPRLAALLPTPNRWGLLLLVGLGAGWFLGNLADVLVVQQFTLVVMLQGLVWTMLGTAITRVLLFPLAFLCFAVPIGDSLIPPLQDFLAVFTVRALQLSGIPVFWPRTRVAVVRGNRAQWHLTENTSFRSST